MSKIITEQEGQLWQELAAAIIKQALWDYKRAPEKIGKEKLTSYEMPKVTTGEIEDFIRSEWFKTIAPEGLSPDYTLKVFKEARTEYRREYAEQRARREALRKKREAEQKPTK